MPGGARGLGDMPLIDAKLIDRLVEAFAPDRGSLIALPHKYIVPGFGDAGDLDFTAFALKDRRSALRCEICSRSGSRRPRSR